MKILLIDPPFYRIFGFYNRYFPLGITSLATFLKEQGHYVLVYDADCNDKPKNLDYTQLPKYYHTYLESFKNNHHPVWEEVRKTIKDFAPDVIGIAIWTTYAASAFHVAKICKELNSACPVIMGGAHATVKAEEILSIIPHVDYVVRGEGEFTTSKLIDALESGKKGLTSITGLSFRYKGKILHNPAGKPSQHLDMLPFPDRSLLLNENKYSPEDMGLIMTSRGCPYSCSYCAVHAKRVSYSSVNHIIDEIKFVKNRYNTTQFTFKDDSFTVNKKRVEQLCDKLIEERLKINWECNTRVDLVNEDLLRKVKKAGCNSIKVGVESGNPRILRQINKGITHEQIRNASKLFKKVGIYWTGYFLMGIPGETVEDIYETLNLMYEIKPDFASIGVYEPFPGTSMFAAGKERGLVKTEMTLDDFYEVLPNHYYKTDSARQVNTIEPEQFNILEKEIKKRFHDYNKNFRRLLKRAASRIQLYSTQPRALFGDLKKYLNWQ